MALQRRRQVAIGCVLVAIVVLSLGVVSTVGAAPSDGDASASTALVAIQDDDEASNETIRHEHPDEAAGEGDDEAVANWLINELGQSLGDSTVQLSEGQYEQAESIVGDEYNDRLEQYVDVNGDVDGEDDGPEPETFEEAQQNQRQFVNSVQSYDETREEYEQARENGDEQRARELARELNDIARNASQSGLSLEETYRNISQTGDVTLDDERDTVETTRRDIERTQSDIREAEFLDTQIDTEIDSPGASFLDPAEITGQVTDEEGAAVADQRVRIRVDGRTVATTTDENGDFQLEYRPALLPVDADTVELELVPVTDSVYLPSNATVAVAPPEVQQVTPDVDVDRATDTAAFGDTVSVTGRVHAADIPADGIPVVVIIDGQFRTAPVRTDADGEFGIEAVLPAGVSSGERNLTVAYPLEDRALASTEMTRPLMVDSTPTELSLSAEETSSETIIATGQLTTTDGDAPTNQSVQLTINGRTVDTVETDADGRFETTIDAQGVATDAETLQLAAVYAQDETNLEDARAEMQLSLASSGSSSSLSPVWWILGGFVILLGVGLLLLSIVSGETFRPTVPSTLSQIIGGNRSDDDGTGQNGHSERPPADDIGEDTEDEDPAEELPLPDVSARQQLEAGHAGQAAVLAYELTRPRLASELADDRARTHWEFYSDWQASDTENRSDALRRLTELYEQAVFAPDPVSTDDASGAIQAAASLVSEPDDQ